VQLPKSALPYQPRRRATGHCRAGNEDEGDDGDEYYGPKDGDDCREPRRYRFFLGERETSRREQMSETPETDATDTTRLWETRRHEGKGAGWMSIRNVAIIKREGPLVRRNVAKDIANSSEGREDNPVEDVRCPHNP